MQAPHDHDLGFRHDLPRMIGRRGVLAAIAGAGAMAASGAQAACVALPWETAGPYPADGTRTRGGSALNVLTKEGVIRRDLRSSFAGKTGTADGVPLNLQLRLVSADGCTPLAGHAIYIWHCDAVGAYSLYNVRDANWLRGVGVADAAGRVDFTTIFPGCYDGRWPHFHFEIFKNVDAAVSGEASLLTAQMATTEADAAQVYAAHPAYANGMRNLGRVSLTSDMIFRDNGAAELAQQTIAMSGDPRDGYVGTLTVPVDLTVKRPGRRGWFN